MTVLLHFTEPQPQLWEIMEDLGIVGLKLALANLWEEHVFLVLVGAGYISLNWGHVTIPVVVLITNTFFSG